MNDRESVIQMHSLRPLLVLINSRKSKVYKSYMISKYIAKLHNDKKLSPGTINMIHHELY